MITRYDILAENKQSDLALLEVDLVTGRTHQIRAHLAHIGYPLLGDGKYGSNKINRALGVKTQALCSYKLTFRFTTESGCLSYLNGKSFEVKKVWFKDKFFEL
jgi:23S rRNA pseudouridine955/2504/2580 synthase